MGYVAHKMVDILLLFLLPLVFLEDKRLRSTEAIVKFADGLRVAEDESSVFGGKFFGELMKLFERTLNVDGSIQEDRKDGLSGTSVIDYLPGEEEVLVVLLEGIFFLNVLGPFEEEDEAVDVGLNPVDEIVFIKGVDFLDLNSRRPYFLDKFGEDPWIGLDGAPLIEH